MRKTATRLWISALILTALGSMAAVTAAEVPKNANAAAAAYAKAKTHPGYAVFVAKGCYECHGRSGAGARGYGPGLIMIPLGLDAFRNYVRAPSGQMPPYSSKILSDQDVSLIHDYLAVVPLPRPVEDIPLLSAVLKPRKD